MTLTKTDRPRAARLREATAMRVRIAALAGAFALLLSVTGVSLSAEVFKHSGLVVEYDPTTHTIVLSEVGPWKVRDGVTVVTRQRIEVTPETQFRIVFRADDAGDEFPGQFVEAPIEAAGIYVDDWVTVECRHEANRMIALTITVLDLPGGIYNPEDGR